MIDDKDIGRLKEIFITRQECQDNSSEMRNAMTRNHLDIAVIKSQLKTITWLLYAVVGGTLANLLDALFGR